LITSEIIATSEQLARVLKLSKGKKVLSTPTYFPAISGSRINHPFELLLATILKSSYPRVLISAYDFSKITGKTLDKRIGEMSNYYRNGGFVFLDSGLFESYWNKDETWSFEDYKKYVKKIDSDLYSAHDQLAGPGLPSSKLFKLTLSKISKSMSLDRNSHCVPIAHGSEPRELIQNALNVSEKFPKDTQIIAVAERDCGRTMAERAITILKLVKAIRKKNDSRALHILGCGNPISLALYSYCGADTFDSLDWSSIVVERNELRIGDFSQLELMNCNCAACSKGIRNPIQKTLLHNLLFYQDFGLKLQDMIRRNTLKDFVLSFIGKKLLQSIH
jgi:queuine/archaeosine tRNA-ribosyltransferase